MSGHEVRDDQLPRNAGGAAVTPATLAASVIVCRNDPFEILLLLRHGNSSFVPDAWVFPGGALDAVDEELAAASADRLQTALKICGLRETLEESGLWLGEPLEDAAALRTLLGTDPGALRSHSPSVLASIDRLTPTSHWITPVGIPKRFDTWFYLALAPREAIVEVDGNETVDSMWISPDTALQRNRAGELSMVFPTIKNIEALTLYDSYDELVKSRIGIDIPAIQPLLVRDGDRKKLIIPDAQ